MLIEIGPKEGEDSEENEDREEDESNSEDESDGLRARQIDFTDSEEELEDDFSSSDGEVEINLPTDEQFRGASCWGRRFLGFLRNPDGLGERAVSQFTQIEDLDKWGWRNNDEGRKPITVDGPSLRLAEGDGSRTFWYEHSAPYTGDGDVYHQVCCPFSRGYSYQFD